MPRLDDEQKVETELVEQQVEGIVVVVVVLVLVGGIVVFCQMHQQVISMEEVGSLGNLLIETATLFLIPIFNHGELKNLHRWGKSFQVCSPLRMNVYSAMCIVQLAMSFA